MKQEISKAVRSKQAVIDNAVQMAAYLNQSEVCDKADSNIHSAKHKARIVKLVNTIERKDVPALIPLKGTRKFHNVRAFGCGKIIARKRSCFCSYCEGKEGGFCPNKKMTGQWVTHQLEAKKKPKEQKGKKETVSYKEKDMDMPSILPSRRKRKTGISTTFKPKASEKLMKCTHSKFLVAWLRKASTTLTLCRFHYTLKMHQKTWYLLKL